MNYPFGSCRRSKSSGTRPATPILPFVRWAERRSFEMGSFCKSPRCPAAASKACRVRAPPGARSSTRGRIVSRWSLRDRGRVFFLPSVADLLFGALGLRVSRQRKTATTILRRLRSRRFFRVVNHAGLIAELIGNDGGVGSRLNAACVTSNRDSHAPQNRGQCRVKR